MMIIRLTAQQTSLLHTEKAMSFHGRSSNDSIESSSPDKDCALIGKGGERAAPLFYFNPLSFRIGRSWPAA